MYVFVPCRLTVLSCCPFSFFHLFFSTFIKMVEKPSESDFECGNLEYGAHASQSSTDSSVDDEPSKEELDSEPEDSLDEEAEADRRSHTLVFKCIGATKSKDYQAVLKKARDLIASGQSVPVRLSKEPQNPYNSRAIALGKRGPGSLFS